MVLITNTIALLAIMTIMAILFIRYTREKDSAQVMLIFAFLLLGANSIGNILNLKGITAIMDEYDSIYPIIFLPTLILAIHIRSIHSELQLRKKSEQLFQDLAESTAIIVYKISLKPQVRFEYINPSVLKITGYSPAEILSKPQVGSPFLHPDEAATFISRLNRPDCTSMIARGLSKEGKTLWLEHRCVIVKDEDGEPDYVIGSAVDITRSKQYEKELEMHRNMLEDLVKDKTKDLETALDKWKESSEELQELNKHLNETNSALSESESKYRLLAENANDVIWLYNVDQEKYEYISPSLYELSGYMPEEILHRNIYTVNTPESGRIQNEMIEKHREKVRKDQGTYAKKIILQEFELICKDGQSKWIETSNKFRLNERNQVELLGITRDITNRRKAEKELSDNREKMVEAEKMASLGILTAGIAHELNNPLNFINGAHKAIIRYIEENADDHREQIMPLLDIINTGLERSVDIVKGLNLFCRSNEANDELCDIQEIIDNCLLMLNSRLKYKAEVNKNYRVKSPVIIGNSGKLHQAFLNILSNAEQAIAETGVIEITTEKTRAGIKTSIRDNGIGIRKEDLKHVMSPFYTTKAPGEGTGLGLSITYTIIHNHGGDLKISSKESRGTTVSVILPAGKEMKAVSNSKASDRD